jgi:hypothetical protein
MKHIEAFIGARDLIEDMPAEAVRLGASALLELSFLKEAKPDRAKKGVPMFKHLIPTPRFLVGTMVKPHLSPFLAAETPSERAQAADNPASLSFSDTMYGNVTYSFDVASGVVSVEMAKEKQYRSGASANTEPGSNAIRNIWREMHLPTIAYVEQAATQLA